jgi:hypothetical protein
MHANMKYAITKKYKGFTGRIFQFVKNNFWLYIPDTILIIILLIPPYSLNEFLLIFTALVILGFRDVVLLKRISRYLELFQVENTIVYITILHFSQTYEARQAHISKINLVLHEEKSPMQLDIYDNNQLMHKQYAIGYWNKERLKDLYQSFNKLKKEMNLGVMFRGASLN